MESTIRSILAALEKLQARLPFDYLLSEYRLIQQTKQLLEDQQRIQLKIKKIMFNQNETPVSSDKSRDCYEKNEENQNSKENWNMEVKKISEKGQNSEEDQNPQDNTFNIFSIDFIESKNESEFHSMGDEKYIKELLLTFKLNQEMIDDLISDEEDSREVCHKLKELERLTARKIPNFTSSKNLWWDIIILLQNTNRCIIDLIDSYKETVKR
jgi:hypothetical protein